MSSKYTYQDIDANYINNKLSNWITGDKLAQLSTYEQSYNKRYVYSKLINFLNTKSNTICAIYGLRRTGKSVLMRQAIRYLIDSGIDTSRIAYITFNKNTTYTDNDLIQKIRTLSKTVDYFFIDEFSYIKFDIDSNSLNLLSDEFAVQGKKIVITGTFSYMIKLLSDDTLLDRIDRIDTTYFSFKEVHEVFGTNIEDFVVYGGIIDTSKRLTPESYMKSAITNNIISSLTRSEKIYEIGYTNKDIDDTIGDNKRLNSKLDILIRRIIDSYMRILVYAKVLKNNYKFSDIGNLADLIRQRSQKESQLESVISIDKNKYNTIINNRLGNIDTRDISKECFNQFIEILKQIGVIEDIFLQHSYESCFITNYIRYGLCEEICNQIDSDIQLETSGRYTTQLALNNLKGSILECIIYLDLKHSNKYTFDKYRNNETGSEVDLILIENEVLHLYEIKYSDQPLAEHSKNIINKDFLTELEQVYNKDIDSYNILYRGQTITKEVNPVEVFDKLMEESVRQTTKEKWQQLEERATQFNWKPITINYINVEEFLCNI